MGRDISTSRYIRDYKKLLRLYPATFQKQFREPMQQTFADLCLEKQQSNQNMFYFLLSAYVDTGFGIIKENYKELLMNIKSNKSKNKETEI